MKVIFLEDVKGSVDGTKVIEYKKDQICEVNNIELNEYLAKSWLKKGILNEYKKVVEEKSIEKSPENKAFDTEKAIKKEKPKKEIAKSKNIKTKKDK